jgi:outer membrane protein
MKPNLFSLRRGLCLAGLGLLAATAQAQTKIGIIDLDKVFRGYWKTKQAEAQLKERAGDFDKARRGMVEDHQKATEEYKKTLEAANDQALSSEERERRKTTAEKKLLEIKEIEQSVNQFDRNSQNELQLQRRRMRDRLLEEMKEVINAKARAGGFALVLDKSGESINNQTPLLVYATGENDITDVVLSELNASAPLNLPETPEKPAEKKDEK